MHLDKIDLCEARAAFDAHASEHEKQCVECMAALLTRFAEGGDWSKTCTGARMLAAVLAARKWHRKKAEKAKERDQ